MTRETRIRRIRRRVMMKRRRRFFGTLIGFACALSVAMCWVMVAAPSISANEGLYRTVTVTPGDSLWSIVSDTCSKDVNIRKVIHEVKKINGLETTCLVVGESIVVPVYN